MPHAQVGPPLRCGIALVGSLAPLIAFEAEDISIHGFVSQGYNLTTENTSLPGSEDGTFEFNEIGLNVASQLTDRLRVGIQLFSRDYGTLGNNTVELDWAYGDYSYRQWLGIRVGRFKTPTGLYNEYRDLDLARVQVQLPDSAYSNHFRDVAVATNGIALYGNVPIADGAGGDIDYDLFTGDLRLDPDGSMGLIFGNGFISEITDTDLKYIHGARLIWNTPLDGLRVGSSYTYYDDLYAAGPSAVPPGGTGSFLFDLYHYYFSAEYIWQDWTFAAEYNRMRGESTVVVNQAIPPSSARVEREGWYLMANYQIDPQWSAGVYYSEHYPDANDRDGDDDDPDFKAWEKVISLSTRYDVDDHWLLKAEIQSVNGTANLFARDNPDGFEEDWLNIFIKSTFIF